MMMEQFQDVLDYARENVVDVLAGGVIALLLIGYLIFTATALAPRLALRAQMADQIATAEAALAQRTGSRQEAPAALQAEIAAAEAELAEAAGVFLTEQEAAGLLKKLYEDADATGVVIQDLQAQTAPADPEKAVYDTRMFRLTAEAKAVPNLTAFVGRIEETAAAPILLQNVNVSQVEDASPPILTMELVIYTSPFAAGGALTQNPTAAETAVPLPTPQPPPTQPSVTTTPGADDIAARLDDLWAAAQWATVIGTIQQIQAIDPAYPGMDEKLYAAHVNYGWQLAAAAQNDAARTHFQQALAIQPDGGEALAGLQSLDPTATPANTGYVVQRGDTLYSIARRFGTTVDAIRAANNLSSNDIHAGLYLVIPAP